MTQAVDLLLPEGARLVHIGPYKTGSSAIQSALDSVREQLPLHGVVYPGNSSRDSQAGWAILGGGLRGFPPPPMERWHALAGEVERAGDARVCVSNEDFGRADESVAQRIVEDLGGSRVHVVAVTRPLDRLLPSQWQQWVRNYETRSYEEWLAAVLGGDDSDWAWHSFWNSHDIRQTVGRWTRSVGMDRMSLIVPDESDRDMLPSTFEQMLGLPDGLLREIPRSNTSTSFNRAELMRRMSQIFADNEWPNATYHYLMQRGVAPHLKRAPADATDQQIPELPAWAVQRVAEISAERANLVKSLDLNVVGDPDKLRTSHSPRAAADERDPSTISIDVAARAIEGAVAGAIKVEARQRRQHERALTATRRKERERGRQEAVQELEHQGARPRNVDQVSSRELLRIVARRVKKRATGVSKQRR